MAIQRLLLSRLEELYFYIYDKISRNCNPILIQITSATLHVIYILQIEYIWGQRYIILHYFHQNVWKFVMDIVEETLEHIGMIAADYENFIIL